MRLMLSYLPSLPIHGLLSFSESFSLYTEDIPVDFHWIFSTLDILVASQVHIVRWGPHRRLTNERNNENNFLI